MAKVAFRPAPVVPPPVVVDLGLTEDEVKVLYRVLMATGGSEQGPRRHASAILDALVTAANYPVWVLNDLDIKTRGAVYVEAGDRI